MHDFTRLNFPGAAMLHATGLQAHIVNLQRRGGGGGGEETGGVLGCTAAVAVHGTLGLALVTRLRYAAGRWP